MRLGGVGQRLGSTGSVPHVGVAALADHDQHQHPDHDVEVRRDLAVPLAVDQLQHADPLATLRQRNPEDRRVLTGGDQLARREHTAGHGAFDEVWIIDRAIVIERLETSERVVGHVHPAAHGAEDLGDDVDDVRDGSGRYGAGHVHDPRDGVPGRRVVVVGSFVGSGVHAPSAAANVRANRVISRDLHDR